ncbi:MAG: MFS transporter [Bryobacterales bacterium]|nr:MFS transporter [Bryobacterales bacterium]MBV9397888.1 MFS transporter [Bryobacterales bacterium]
MQRRDQRNAVLAGFLGWTFDAFDFFVLTFLIADIGKAFGKSRPEVALTLTLTLAMRPVGALLFGVMADRYGRRLPMAINIVFYAVVSALSGLAPTFQIFLILRMLFGIGMGGQWGVSASLALESISPKWRGLISGMLHQGYSLGNLLAATAFLFVYPAMQSAFPANAWRFMFFLGGLPALISFFVLTRVKESEAWHEHRTDWRTYVKSLPPIWRRFLYLVLMLAAMGFISHGTQDLYPTFLLQQRKFSQTHAAIVTIISMLGATFGGIVVGYCSDRFGRRRAMIGAVLGGVAMIPLWIGAPGAALLAASAFMMQFCVQGAWGIIPAHMNELTPAHLRGFVPGFAYQIGMLIAGIVPYLEALVGEHFSYALSMGGFAAVALLAVALIVSLGPEAHGISFRKGGESLTTLKAQASAKL